MGETGKSQELTSRICWCAKTSPSEGVERPNRNPENPRKQVVDALQRGDATKTCQSDERFMATG